MRNQVSDSLVNRIPLLHCFDCALSNIFMAESPYEVVDDALAQRTVLEDSGMEASAIQALLDTGAAVGSE